MLTLQINTAGAWKNVAQFDPTNRDEVLNGLKGLAQALGDQAKWCIVDATGKREWLDDIHTGAFPGWNDYPQTSPAPLEDVLISAWDASENEGVVFMAWLSATTPGRWMISGSDEPVLLPVYAWGPVMSAHEDIPAALTNREAA